MKQDPNELIDVFAQVARSLASMDDVQGTLQQIVEIAADVVPGAEHAGVSLVVKRRDVQTPASTSEIVQKIDAAQYESGEGPCLDAIFEQEVVLVDLDSDERWPEFRKTPLSVGINAVLAFRLFVEEDTAGALNLYAAAPGSLAEESVRVGRVLAAHAAVALEHAQEVERLERAVSTRQAIGQAEGILMERHRITHEQAFNLLRDTSMARNEKLREVAQTVVETGALPD